MKLKTENLSFENALEQLETLVKDLLKSEKSGILK